MMKKIGMAIMALCMSTLSLAENTLHYNLLEFQESVSVHVPNDTMHITLTIETQQKNRQAASNMNTKKLNQVFEKIKKNKNFTARLGSRSVDPQYDEKRKNIISWRDSVSLHVESKAFDDLSKLIGDVSEQAILEGMWFTVSSEKRNQAVEQASEQVVDTLRQRADFISKKMGFSSYQFVKVNMESRFSSQSEDYGDHFALNMRRAVPMAAAAPSMKIGGEMSGKQSISQTANVVIQMR